MAAQPREIKRYVNEKGEIPFDQWFESLRDIQAQARIDVRLERVKLGNFGDYCSVGEGVFELRIDYGPGYRVYFGQVGLTITLEQIYATILYYLHESEKIKQYMAIWLDHCLTSARQQDENPSDYILKLRQLKAEKQAEKRTTYEHPIPV